MLYNVLGSFGKWWYITTPPLAFPYPKYQFKGLRGVREEIEICCGSDMLPKISNFKI